MILLYLNFFYDVEVVLYQSLFERGPLLGRDAGVDGGQLPQGDQLVAEGGAGVLAGLAVGVDLLAPGTAAPASLSDLGVEPPHLFNETDF